MASHDIQHLQLLCLFCQRRVTCAGGMLGDPFWRVHCARCEVTTLFPLDRYTTPAQIVKTWGGMHRQGELFGRAS